MLFVILFISIYYALKPQPDEKIRFDEFAAKIVAGEVKGFKTESNKILIELENGDKVQTTKPIEQSTYEALKDRFSGDSEALEELNKAREEIKDPNESTLLLSFLNYAPIWILMAFAVYFFYSQMSKSGSGALSFGSSKPKLFNPRNTKTMFKNVGGIDEVVDELKEVVDFLKFPKKYVKIGAEIPKGVLLIGPPGTGKTLVAKAVAGEAKVPFFSISGSEFVEMFVGVGASRVRDLFRKAKKVAPAIVFIDEIDAVGRKRGSGMGGGHDEREQTLNQILVEMDGFETNQGVIVMAATNRVDVLDKALLRPGRFDRRVTLDLPDIAGREAILKLYMVKKPIAKDVKVKKIASMTPGFSGADLKNVVNEAALWTAKYRKTEISVEAFNEAIEKVALGPQKKSKRISDREKDIVAIHEVGHAIVGHILPECDPIHKVSVIARGGALGVTWSAPIEESYLVTKKKFVQDIASLMGGYAAEKTFFGDITTGASNDLLVATAKARGMITRYGMSNELGPISFGGYESAEVSEKTAEIIDLEVREILKKGLDLALETVKKHKKISRKIADKLLEVETLDSEEFEAFFKKPKRKTVKKINKVKK